jgi:Patatin-like phospholipase
VAGASAGAMAAIMLAAGVSPLAAAEFCTTITLDKFADFPGLLSIFRGDRFEEIMAEFLLEASPIKTLQLEDAVIPVAVSAFDIQRLKGEILSTGSMARAARASATFPGLFQPVGWIDNNSGENFVFIDGGITDFDGLNGLKATFGTSEEPMTRRVINMVVGDFPFSIPGPSSMPSGVTASSVISISIRNLPQCGPWAMENGPLAVQAARRAIKKSLDRPLFLAGSGEESHYELHIDARSFV